MHDIFTVGVPLIAILAGILFARSDVKDLRKNMQRLEDKMDARFAEVNARINRIEAELSKIDDHLIQFHAITGKLDGRLDALERQQQR